MSSLLARASSAWGAVARQAEAASLFHTARARTREFATRVPDGDVTRPRVIQRKPTTPSQRHTALIDRSLLWKGRPLSRLTEGLPRRGGRSRTTGQITVRHRGGGHKRKYRLVDFKRSHWTDIPGKVERVEYDPNRSAFIALLRHAKQCTPVPGKVRKERYAYILCPAGLKIGSEVVASRTGPVDVQVGNAMLLQHIPVGTKVHNVEIHPGHGGQLCRSAGTSAQLLERDTEKGLALLRLQSKEVRYVRINCMASIGEVSNPEHKNQSYGKAGRMRWKGWRPSVRGVAMNPVDHPHGGGEGKTSGGRPSVSKWSKPTKGYRTVRKKDVNPLIVKRRFQ